MRRWSRRSGRRHRAHHRADRGRHRGVPRPGGTGGSTGFARRQELRRRRDRAPGAPRSRGPASGTPRRRPRGRRRRCQPEGRRAQRHLRRVDRRSPARPQDRREGAAQAPGLLPLHRAVRSAPRRPRQGHRPAPLRPEPQGSGDAPRTRDPSPGARRDSPVGRRVVDRRGARRAGRPDRRLPRHRRRARVGRGACGAAPQSPVVAGDRAARLPHARRRGAGDAGRARPGHREARRPRAPRGSRAGRADSRRVLLVAGPDPRVARAVVRRRGGHDQCVGLPGEQFGKFRAQGSAAAADRQNAVVDHDGAGSYGQNGAEDAVRRGAPVAP